MEDKKFNVFTFGWKKFVIARRGRAQVGASPGGPKLHTNPIHKTYTIHTEKVYPDIYNSACFCSIIIVNCRHAVSAFCICLMLA